MAQTSVTGLLTGSSTPFLASGDVVAFVDVSDTTQSPSGSLVKGTLTQFFAQLPVPVAILSNSATAFAVGRQGATDPALLVDASTASSATGLKVKSAAAAGGVAVSVISSGTNESVTFDAKGSGTITLGGTSTGAITLARATTVTGALTTASGILATGTVSGLPVALLASGSSDGGIGIRREGTANTTDETFLAMYARADGEGTYRKQMSISSKWADTNATNGYAVLRINSDQIVAGTTTDDIQLRLFGGHGLSVFGPDDSTFPGAATMGVYGTVSGLTAVATPSAFGATKASYFASTVSGAVLMGYGTTGDVTLKNRAGTSVLYVGPNTTAVTMAGDLTIAGALAGATTVNASSTITTDGFVITGGTGGTGNGSPWKLGVVNAVSPTSPNRTLTVNINGSVYYIAAKTTND